MIRLFTAAVALALVAAPAFAAGPQVGQAGTVVAQSVQTPAGKDHPAKPATAKDQDVKKKAPAANAATPATPAVPGNGTVTR